ncbi:MAG TPA: tetratricopeptide repeat protein, partial [Gemmatimonadaceae bacterium]|nr:tetratricopeptide repeat protein [Gemmatimonadaceae bacterium]
LLNVSTYNLRKALGETSLLTEVDDLRLNPDVVSTDVAEFELALEREDVARAAALYRGSFLDGFFVSDAPAFEEWAERERKRLAASYGRAVEALAEAAEGDRDFAGALHWWKVRAAHDPYDSRVALRLMEAMEASGNRAGALQHADVHQRLLRTEFGVASAPAVAELAERLRRESGVRLPSASSPVPSALDRDVQRPEPEGRTAPEAEPATVESSAVPGATASGSAVRVASRRRWLRVLAPLAFVAIAGIVWAARPSDPGPERSIVVLPFVNLSPNEDNEYFADGLTEEVITRLASIPGLKVISRTSAMYYKGSKKPLREIADELDVAHVLEGSVRRSDGRVRVSAQLIDASTDEHRWAENYEYELRASFRMQEEIARAVARALEVELGERVRRQLGRRGTDDPEAYELYQRARLLWQTRTRDAHEQAIRYYTRAIEIDSSYADAWAGLSDVYLTAYQLNLLGLSEAESYSRVKSAAERALALDDESAAAHTSFAIALWWERNWVGAMRELRRALESNPGDAMARSWYSLLLRATGRSEQAIQEARRAYELDPFAVVTSANVGWQCLMTRDYDCAIAQQRRTISIGDYPNSHVGLALAHVRKGQFDDAVGAARKAVEIAPQRPDILADLAYVLASSGRTDEAREALRRAKAQSVEPYNVGRAHVGLSEPDSAFAWLERASWHWPHRALLADPALDPVRADPRFAELEARVAREMGIR